MDTTNGRAGSRGRLRSLASRIEQQLRLQRELLWHPRLGLAGSRQPATVRIPADHRGDLPRH